MIGRAGSRAGEWLAGLVRREEGISSMRDAIGWWEVRRVPYNLIVGAAGVVTCCLFASVALVSTMLGGEPVGLSDPMLLPMMAAVGYAVGANACFTGGWAAELVVRVLWPKRADWFATRTFTLGLLFSVALTLLPGVFLVAAMSLAGILRLLGVTAASEGPIP